MGGRHGGRRAGAKGENGRWIVRARDQDFLGRSGWFRSRNHDRFHRQARRRWSGPGMILEPVQENGVFVIVARGHRQAAGVARESAIMRMRMRGQGLPTMRR